MRLAKKVLLSALLPLFVIALGAVFAPTPPTEAALVASTEPVSVAAPAQPAEDLITAALDRARGLWLAALGVSASC